MVVRYFFYLGMTIDLYTLNHIFSTNNICHTWLQSFEIEPRYLFIAQTAVQLPVDMVIAILIGLATLAHVTMVTKEEIVIGKVCF